MTEASNVAPLPSWTDNLGRSVAPLRDRVTDIIRTAILDFELPPGQRLIERELIERLSVSRTTVRDALLQLTTEGLVVVTPQRGAAVAAPTPDEAHDLYETRALLEGLAARLFTERATPHLRGQLREAFDSMTWTLENVEDVLPKLQSRDRFDTVLIEGASSRHLQRLIGTLRARVRALRAASLAYPGRPQQALAEVRVVVEAIEAGDAAAAAAACVAHVRHAAAIGLRQLRSTLDTQPHLVPSTTKE